jgi:hypothetical protein
MRAPIIPSGSMTRRIGRRDSDSSPIIVDVNGWAARIPASMRIVVPEFPASSGADGERNWRRPRPSIVTTWPLLLMSTPRPRRHVSVDWQSAPGA